MKWVLQRIDQLGDTVDVSKDPVLKEIVSMFLANGHSKQFKYPEKMSCMKLQIESSYLLPNVDGRKALCITPSAAIAMDHLIDGLMEHELFTTAEIYVRCSGTVQKAIVDFLIKYDLDENELSLDACDKRIKRAFASGRITDLRSKKKRNRIYSNGQNKQNKNES